MLKKVILLALVIVPGLGFSQSGDTVIVVRKVDSLIQVSRTLTGQRDFDKALEVIASAEKLALEKLGRETASYGSACFNHGRLLYLKGNNQEAEGWYLEAKYIREKVLGKAHPDYANCLNNLAILEYYLGNYEKAELLYSEALAIREKALGKEHADYVSSLTNLGLLYKKIGNYEKAEPMFLGAKAIREKAFGKEHTDYAASTYNLAWLYDAMGNYEKAEPFFLETKAIQEKLLGKEHHLYAMTLHGLGILYIQIGIYEKAEPLLLEAKDIWEKTLGKEHSNYVSSLNELGLLYNSLGNYEKAEPLLLEAKSIWEKILGKEHPDYGKILHNLATVYLEMNAYEKAEQIFFETKALREKALGKEHPEYARCLTNMAILYTRMNGYEKAESLFLEGKAILEKALGKEHPDYSLVLKKLADLYEKQKRFSNSEPLAVELSESEHKRLLRSTTFLSEGELLQYIASLVSNGDRFGSYLLARPSSHQGSLPGLAFDHALFYKGFLLNTSNRIKRLALPDSAATEKFKLLQSCEHRLAAEYSKPIVQRKNVPGLEASANDLEKELVRTVAGYGEAIQQIRWQDVQKKLKSNEVAVEFIHYNYRDIKQSDSIMYAALVLRPNHEAPIFISLFEEREIGPLLEGAKGGNVRGINALYLQNGQKSLYDLIWKPLESQLKGVNTVYCSLSGLLHRLNLGAVSTFLHDGGETFADQHQLVLLNSTRQLVIPTATKNDGHEGYIVGGVRYNINSTTLDSVYADYASRDMAASLDEVPFQLDSTSRGGIWNYLPQTATEALDINHVLVSSKLATQLDTGFFATEESLRSLGAYKPSPRILHIATHGFFFADPKESVSNKQSANGNEEIVFKTSDNPMIRSGLILAGAQQAWTTGKASEKREDGILTAYEISQMNLSNTELVVLSACETGLGDIEGNEGVYGLQRAFKIAGAKYLIMSLWKVNDQSTRELMTDFYRQWLEKGFTIPDAFHMAQQNIKVKYKDPYHWAGFVLVE